jgi:hypothetical protein
MSNDSDNIRVAQNGKIMVGPVGSTAPVDLTTPWDAAWIDFGYLSTDGVAMNYSTETEDVDVWQSVSSVRKILTGVDMTLAFTAMEFKRPVVTFYFPSSSISTSGGVHTLSIPSAPDSDERAFGLEWTDGSVTNRLIVPRGEGTERGEITLSRSAAVGLQLTVSAYANSTPDIATWLSNDPAWAA